MLPLFYSDQLSSGEKHLILDEETSRHIVHVLRMTKREQLQLTDGKGNIAHAIIEDDHKKRVLVNIENLKFESRDNKKLSIAISLLKNTSRFEWFLEKATEIGITEIIPAICHRTERQHFRFERMQSILVSAMLQSRQVWMPQLYEPMKIEEIIATASHQQKFIAHCIGEQKEELSNIIDVSSSSQMILIGPEGDFTNEEVQLAIAQQFLPVALGNNRLRAETAGVVAAVILKYKV